MASLIGDELRPTPLELAAGQILRAGRLALLPADGGGKRPLEALEEAIRPTLETGRCFVGFSGGRDSSAVLAVATRLARREGYGAPIPVTMRFPGRDPADETEWQEDVVRHLRCDEWIRLPFGDELHVLGPVARSVVRRHGVLWPANAYLHAPLFEVARGGALLTGLGGDEILGGVRWRRTAAVLAREVRPRPRDVLGLGYALSPRPLRRYLGRRSLRAFGPWLRAGARRRAIAALAAHAAAEPFGWGDRFRWWLGTPYIEIGAETLRRLAADWSVRVVHPLLEARFVAAIASLPAEERWTTRASAMRRLFGDLLPDPTLRRASKATFGHIFDAGPRIDLVRRWAGEGVDPELVDPGELRSVWSAPELDPSSAPLLQHVALILGDAGQEDASSSMSVATAGRLAGSRGR